MLEMRDVCVSFKSERQEKIFGHTRQQVLFDISFQVKKGICLGGLLKPDRGETILDGVSVYGSRTGRKNLQNKLSVVFQDYTTSANPRFRIRDIIGEGLTVRERREEVRLNREAETAQLLKLVGLPTEFAAGVHCPCGGLQTGSDSV